MRHKGCPGCTCDLKDSGIDWLMVVCAGCFLLGGFVAFALQVRPPRYTPNAGLTPEQIGWMMTLTPDELMP